MNSKKTSVFVSFCKKDEVIANQIEEKISPFENVVRYEQLKLGDDFPTYMQSIVKQDYVIIILSDAYMRSSACMYEVDCLMGCAGWRKNTFFVVQDRGKDFYSDFSAFEYIEYWNTKCCELKSQINKYPDNNTCSEQNKCNDYKHYANIVSPFLQCVREKNNKDVDTAVDALKDLAEQSFYEYKVCEVDKVISSVISGFKSNKQKIYEFLKSEKAITKKEFCRQLDLTPSQARTALKRLVDDGVLLRLGKGKNTAYVFNR